MSENQEAHKFIIMGYDRLYKDPKSRILIDYSDEMGELSVGDLLETLNENYENMEGGKPEVFQLILEAKSCYSFRNDIQKSTLLKELEFVEKERSEHCFVQAAVLVFSGFESITTKIHSFLEKHGHVKNHGS